MAFISLGFYLTGQISVAAVSPKMVSFQNFWHY